MNKIIKIGIFVVGVLLLVLIYYFLLFHTPKSNNDLLDINTFQDVYVTDINIDTIDCNNDNLEEVIYIKETKLTCLKVNNKYTWVSIDENIISDINTDINIEQARSDLRSQKVYAFAGQRCSNRNLNTTAEDKTTGELLTCVDKGNSVYMWQSSSIPDTSQDENTPTEPEDIPSNNNTISLGDECTFFQEFQQATDSSSGEQLVCLMADEAYTWQIPFVPEEIPEEEGSEPGVELIYEGAPCDIYHEFQTSPDVNNPSITLRCLFSDGNFVWIKEE